MKLTKLSMALIAGSLMLVAASANAGVTGSAAFTTDYLFRGISQTTDSPAVQAGLTYSFDSGVYVSAWGSSVADYISPGGLELDTLLGYSGKSGNVGYDVGVMRYNYPGYGKNTPISGGNEADYNEVYGSVSAYGAKFGLNYSPDYYFESDKFIYAYIEYGTEVGAGVSVFGHVGYNVFDSDTAMGKALAITTTDDTYTDYKVAASKAFEGITVELAYIGSTVDDAQCYSICEGRAVLTATKAF